MKVLIPVAGLGTRLRPHTYSKPKPLVSVAGKPVLGHVLDDLRDLPVEEIIFITGYLGDQIEEYVRTSCPFPSRFVEQHELLGQAHAINLARDFITAPILIIFVDTIFKADLSGLAESSEDGVIFAKTVEDPRRFGVAVVENGLLARLVEKPKTPVSNLAVVGVYYLKNWQLFREALAEILEGEATTGGEYYLADALQRMVDRGARIRVDPVEVWEDCGTVDAIIQTNRYLLQSGHTPPTARADGCVIVPPVYIAPTATVTGSILGPFASIAEGAVITNSIIQDSIVCDGASISNATLTGSLIGSNATVRGALQRLNIGDFSDMELMLPHE